MCLEGVWQKGKHHLNTTILPTFIAETGQGFPALMPCGATFGSGRGFPKLALRTAPYTRHNKARVFSSKRSVVKHLATVNSIGIGYAIARRQVLDGSP